MFDEFSTRNRAIRAAFEIAADRGWNQATFAAIAKRTGISLADLRREFSDRADILKAFQAEVDAEVLARIKPDAAEHGIRDRLFDIIMTRFDVLQPYKPALVRICDNVCCHPAEAAQIACSTLDSQYWMLNGAGAKLDGAGGCLRTTGLAAIYANVFQVWLNDTTPNLDRTMAALDRKLKRGEEWLVDLESICARVCRFAGGLVPRGWTERQGDTTPG